MNRDESKPNTRDLQYLIKDLGRAVVQAISTSEDVQKAMREIRHEGFSITVTLNCEQEGRQGVKLDLTPRQAVAPANPTFRVDGDDVALLKSLGIDATRSAPRRRGH